MDSLIKDIMGTISYYFGDETARIYEDSFKDKDNKTIAAFTRHLLCDYVGKNKANSIIKPLEEKYIIKHIEKENQDET